MRRGAYRISVILRIANLEDARFNEMIRLKNPNDTDPECGLLNMLHLVDES